MAANQDRPPESALSDVESIQNLDTARMTLRWALERLRALEKRSQELEESARRAEAVGARNAAELAAARDLLTRRSAETLERERYYGKLEEFLSLKLAGQLDAAALARREASVERHEKQVQDQEIDVERRLKASKEHFEEELRRRVAQATSASDARASEAQKQLDERLALREREHSARLLSLHEKEAALKVLERSLEERSRRFQEFFAIQRAEIEREAAALAQTAKDQAAMQEQRAAQALATRTQALEAAWQVERRMLLEELAEWRTKAREHLPALLAATRRAEVAEERLSRAEPGLAALQRESEERQAELMALHLTEEARREDVKRLESALSGKLREAEEHMFRQYDAWVKREDEAHRRDKDWLQQASARREETEAVRSQILALREELKRAIAAYRAKADADVRGSSPGGERT